MPEPILVRYKAVGIPEVNAAFDTIERRIVGLTASTTRGAGQRVASANTEATGMTAAKAREERAAEQAETRKTRDVEREARKRQAITDRGARAAERDAEKVAKAEAAALTEGTRALEREMRRREQIRERSAIMAGHYYEREVAAEQAARKRLGTTISGSVLSGTSRAVGGMTSMAGMAAGALGAFAVADAVRDRFAAEKSAAQIVNAVTSGGVTPQGANVKNILSRAGAVGIKTGMSKEAVTQAALIYSRNAKGGDFAGTMGNMEFFAKMAKTTGADINQLAEGAGTLQSQNKNLKAPEMQQLLMNAYEMSKAGTMGFSEAIKTFGLTGATRSSYSGNVATNQSQLLALAQLAKSGGTAEEAGTFIKDIATEAGQADKRFHKQTGKHLLKFDPTTGQMGSPEEVVEQVFRSTGGNIKQIRELFGQRGSVLFGELAPSFQAASKAAGGGKAGLEAGIQAAMGEVRSVTGATMTPDQLESQFQQVMATTPERFNVAVEKIRDHIEEKLVPMLEKLADKFGDPAFIANIDKIIDALGWLANFFLENPFKGIGAVVLASITKDLAAAAIGAAVREIMIRSLGGAVAGEAAGGVAGGLLGKGGAALGGAALVGGVLVASTAAGVAGAYGIGQKSQAALTHGEQAGEAHVQGLLDISAHNPAEAAKKALLLREAIEAGKNTDTNMGYGKAFVRSAEFGINAIAGSDVTGAAEATAREEHARVLKANTILLEAALKSLTDAINAGAKSVGGSDPSTRTGPIGPSGTGVRGGAL